MEKWPFTLQVQMASCHLCKAAPGQQVFTEQQSNLPLSTFDIGLISCCIFQVVY